MLSSHGGFLTITLYHVEFIEYVFLVFVLAIHICGLCHYKMNCALSWCEILNEVPFSIPLTYFDFGISIQHPLVKITLGFVQSICNSYKEKYNITL